MQRAHHPCALKSFLECWCKGLFYRRTPSLVILMLPNIPQAYSEILDEIFDFHTNIPKTFGPFLSSTIANYCSPFVQVYLQSRKVSKAGYYLPYFPQQLWVCPSVQKNDEVVRVHHDSEPCTEIL